MRSGERADGGHLAYSTDRGAESDAEHVDARGAENVHLKPATPPALRGSRRAAATNGRPRRVPDPCDGPRGPPGPPRRSGCLAPSPPREPLGRPCSQKRHGEEAGGCSSATARRCVEEADSRYLRKSLFGFIIGKGEGLRTASRQTGFAWWSWCWDGQKPCSA